MKKKITYTNTWWGNGVSIKCLIMREADKGYDTEKNSERKWFKKN